MFRKKETEFQYAPGIEKIIEDIQGGRTIAHAELKGIIDELPPLVIVGEDSNGLYHAVKTARVTAAVATAATVVQVAKRHLFKVGEVITVGDALKRASDLITATDKSNASYDTITVAGAIGVIAIGDALILANIKVAANAAKFKYVPEAITMNKVDVAVANQQSGLLVRDTVNESVMPYLIDKNLKTMPGFIRFV